MNQPEYLGKRGNPDICTAIFLTKGGKVLYGLRHYTKAALGEKRTVWTTPGGRCEEREPIEENLRREILEETGINLVVITKFLGIRQGAKIGDTLYIYQGTTTQEPILKEPEKFSQWRWWEPGIVLTNFINPSALLLYHQAIKG